MKLYIVERKKETVGYDEIESVVVWANNKEKALECAIDYDELFSEKTVKVVIVQKPYNKSQIVHVSYEGL